MATKKKFRSWEKAASPDVRTGIHWAPPAAPMPASISSSTASPFLPTTILAAVLNGTARPWKSHDAPLKSTVVSSVFSQEAEQTRRAIQRFTQLLSQIEDSDLSYDRRTEVIGAIADRMRRDVGSVYEDAARRLIGAEQHGVMEEAVAALIRYFSVQETTDPGLISGLISAIESPSELKSIAAARTLGNIGDSGTIPRIKSAVARSKNNRVQAEAHRAIKNIAYATGEGS